MLKRRIIPLELLNDDRLIKTLAFDSPRDVGDPLRSSQVYSDQDADEIVLLNVSRNKRDVNQLVKSVYKIAQQCFVPLTVGGGIKCIKDAERLFSVGADKIVLNSAAYNNDFLITQIGDHFGQQAVVVGIDVKRKNDTFILFSDCGRKQESISLSEHISKIINSGASEIMIQSIDQDGTMLGFDLHLLLKTLDLSSVPVIAAGGAGNFLNLKEAFDIGVDAVACGSLFNFGDNNPLRAKSFLKNYNIPLKKI